MTLTLPIQIDPDSAPDETLHVTASGLPVRIYATDGGGTQPIHGAIFEDGKWYPHSWWANGAYGAIDVATGLDLRDRAPVKRGWWIGVYTKGEARFASTFPSERDALIFNAGEGWKRFAVHYLEEGDGLETPADPPLWVDWSKLPGWAKWAAADECGGSWFYNERPHEVYKLWRVTGVHARCAPLEKHLYRLAPDFDWRKTLIQRPEDV